MKDWCDEDGAKRLREKISAYWAERGYEVDVDLIDAGFVPAMRSARTDVRAALSSVRESPIIKARSGEPPAASIVRRIWSPSGFRLGTLSAPTIAAK